MRILVAYESRAGTTRRTAEAIAAAARAAIDWVRRLPPLEKKPAAVFCTYAFNPRRSLALLTAALEDKGARVVDGHAFHRRDPEAGVEGFVVRALAAAGPEGPGSATTGGPEPR